MVGYWVWYGMGYGMVWCGMVRYGVGYSMVWYGAAWRGVARHAPISSPVLLLTLGTSKSSSSTMSQHASIGPVEKEVVGCLSLGGEAFLPVEKEVADSLRWEGSFLHPSRHL